MASVGHLQGLHHVKLVKNPDYKRNGLKSLGHLVRKYEITPTLECPFTMVQEFVDDGLSQITRRFRPKRHETHGHAVNHMVSKDSTGRLGHVAAEDVQNDSEYLAQVEIGTPAQKMSLDFDTGSSDLWVWSTELPDRIESQGKSTGHNIFDASKSSTFKSSNGQSWQIQYGDGSKASGSVGTDVLKMGGLSIENQAIELARTLSSAFTETKGDGLLGLAFGTINTVRPHPVHTPVENMMQQSDIPKTAELFTAYLTNHIDGVPPCYTFGYIDQDLVNGAQIHYTPIDSSQGFWQVASCSATINNTHIPLTNNTTIMDTGTTLALIDDNTAKAIYAAIPCAKYDARQGGYVFPTKTARSALPDIRLAIGDHEVVIDKDDIGFAEATEGWTYGGFQSRGNMPFSIYGGSVLKSMYAIFDQGNKRFGFCQKVDLQK